MYSSGGYSYHFQKMQYLEEGDLSSDLEFCQFKLNTNAEKEEFFTKNFMD